MKDIIHQRSLDKKVKRDLRTLARFIETFCKGRHKDASKQPVDLKTHEVENVIGRPLALCEDCARLMAHAFVKRALCPFEPKPACKHCPRHCYHPKYREQIREVMKYSGWRLVLRGRLDYLLHMLWPARKIDIS